MKPATSSTLIQRLAEAFLQQAEAESHGDVVDKGTVVRRHVTTVQRLQLGLVAVAAFLEELGADTRRDTRGVPIADEALETALQQCRSVMAGERVARTPGKFLQEQFRRTQEHLSRALARQTAIYLNSLVDLGLAGKWTLLPGKVGRFSLSHPLSGADSTGEAWSMADGPSTDEDLFAGLQNDAEPADNAAAGRDVEVLLRDTIDLRSITPWALQRYPALQSLCRKSPPLLHSLLTVQFGDSFDLGAEDSEMATAYLTLGEYVLAYDSRSSAAATVRPYWNVVVRHRRWAIAGIVLAAIAGWIVGGPVPIGRREQPARSVFSLEDQPAPPVARTVHSGLPEGLDQLETSWRRQLQRDAERIASE